MRRADSAQLHLSGFSRFSTDNYGSSSSKRCLDLTFASLAIIFLSPIFIIIGMLVALERRGPIIFRQYRYTRGGRLFTIYKFRTMQLQSTQLEGETQTGRDDPRIT